MYDHWKSISIVEIVYYAIAITISIYPTFKLLINQERLMKIIPVSNFKPFMFRYSFIITAKFVAGILLVVYIPQLNRQISNPDASEANTHLLIGSIVLNSISFGFMNIANLIIVQYIDRLQIYLSEGDEFPSKFKFFGSSIILLLVPINAITEFKKGHYALALNLSLSKLTFYAVIINIVGSSRINGPLTVEYRQVTKHLLMAGSIIYIIATACASGYIVYKRFFENQTASNAKYASHIRKLLTFNLLMCPFLLVRMIFNVCSASSLNVHGSFAVNPSRFTFLFGDYKIYAGMAFTMELICTIWLCCIIWTLYLDTCINTEKEVDSKEVGSNLGDY